LAAKANLLSQTINAPGIANRHVISPPRERNKLWQRRETVPFMTRKLHQALANLIEARLDCIQSGNDELRNRHQRCGDQLVQEYMPRSGEYSRGATLDWSRSLPDKLVFSTSFHHTDEAGLYTHETTHLVTVRAHLARGYKLSITRSNRGRIRNFVTDAFGAALDQNIPDEKIWSARSCAVAAGQRIGGKYQ